GGEEMVTRREAIVSILMGSAAATLGPMLTLTSCASPKKLPTGIIPQEEKHPTKYRPPFRFGLGGAPIGGSLGIAVTDEEARKILEAAWEGGVRSFDTSPWYGLGLSERRFGG